VSRPAASKCARRARVIRTEFDTVVIQSDACNGCRDCISACPFGVIDINPVSHTAQKCTLCYDRLQGGLEPPARKPARPSRVQFGTIRELRARAGSRVEQLHKAGESRAYLYGADEKMLGGLNSFYLLVDPAGGLRIAARSEAAVAQSDSRVAVYDPGSDRRRPRRHLQLPQSRREAGRRREAMTGAPSSTCSAPLHIGSG